MGFFVAQPTEGKKKKGHVVNHDKISPKNMGGRPWVHISLWQESEQRT